MFFLHNFYSFILKILRFMILETKNFPIETPNIPLSLDIFIDDYYELEIKQLYLIKTFWGQSTISASLHILSQSNLNRFKTPVII